LAGAPDTPRAAGAAGASKEILPLPGPLAIDRPAVVEVLERLALGGVTDALVLLRPGKDDVRLALGDGRRYGVRLDYLVQEATPSVPHTLLPGLRAAGDREVVLAFPDLLFWPRDALSGLRATLEGSNAAGVLGLFPTDRPEKADMVVTGEHGRLVDLCIKDGSAAAARGCRYTWSIAVLRPPLCRFFEQGVPPAVTLGGAPELWVGDLLRAAVRAGHTIATRTFDDGVALDIGTPDDLERARRRLALQYASSA
jgi:glucose-1-phosphate thymidylyltransferase